MPILLLRISLPHSAREKRLICTHMATEWNERIDWVQWLLIRENGTLYLMGRQSNRRNERRREKKRRRGERRRERNRERRRRGERSTMRRSTDRRRGRCRCRRR